MQIKGFNKKYMNPKIIIATYHNEYSKIFNYDPS